MENCGDKTVGFIADAIVLVGHGAPALDTPSALVSELKQLEIQRRQGKMCEMTPRELELDRLIRAWPRTPETDSYKFGLEKLADKLAPKLGNLPLVIAYNEFCMPSVGDAITSLVQSGAKHITLMPTMFTPGGSHSELEIPEIIHELGKHHQGIRLTYAWPVDVEYLADFIAGHLKHGTYLGFNPA